MPRHTIIDELASQEDLQTTVVDNSSLLHRKPSELGNSTDIPKLNQSQDPHKVIVANLETENTADERLSLKIEATK